MSRKKTATVAVKPNAKKGARKGARNDPKKPKKMKEPPLKFAAKYNPPTKKSTEVLELVNKDDDDDEDEQDEQEAGDDEDPDEMEDIKQMAKEHEQQEIDSAPPSDSLSLLILQKLNNIETLQKESANRITELELQVRGDFYNAGGAPGLLSRSLSTVTAATPPLPAFYGGSYGPPAQGLHFESPSQSGNSTTEESPPKTTTQNATKAQFNTAFEAQKQQWLSCLKYADDTLLKVKKKRKKSGVDPAQFGNAIEKESVGGVDSFTSLTKLYQDFWFVVF